MGIGVRNVFRIVVVDDENVALFETKDGDIEGVGQRRKEVHICI